MRIDSNNNYLSLERVEPQGSAIVRRVAGGVAKEGCIAAFASRAKVHTAPETPERMADFAAQRSHRFELMLSRGGWLRLRRGRSGRTRVRYRLGQWSAGAALEGGVRLECQPAKAFCRQLGGLL